VESGQVAGLFKQVPRLRSPLCQGYGAASGITGSREGKRFRHGFLKDKKATESTEFTEKKTENY